MSTEPIPVHISNVNGVRDLAFNLTEFGVYVLRGGNGAGKSNAAQALRAATGAENAKAEPSDGEEEGFVEMGGVRMIVGRNRLESGLPSVHLADDGQIGKLIEPRLKNPEAANRARMDALLNIVPLPADEEAKAELTDKDFEFASSIRGSYPSALAFAHEVKDRAHKLAREKETQAEQLEGEVGVIMRDLAGQKVETSSLTVADAEATYEQMTREAIEARAKAVARADLEKRQAEIRASIGERPNTRADAEALGGAQINFEEAKIAYVKAEAEMKRRHQIAYETGQRAIAWEAQAEILERPADGPTLAEADKAEEVRAGAKRLLEAAKAAEAQRLLRERLGNAKTKQDKAKAEGERFRKLAKRIPYALGRILQRAGIEGLSIDDDGNLEVTGADGRRVPWARLSMGQRTSMALSIALHAYRKRATSLPCTLILEPEFWLSLDAENQAAVIAAAKERQVYLLVEEPAGGELRVERAGAST